jgi:hypothetical protein
MNQFCPAKSMESQWRFAVKTYPREVICCVLGNNLLSFFPGLFASAVSQSFPAGWLALGAVVPFLGTRLSGDSEACVCPRVCLQFALLLLFPRTYEGTSHLWARVTSFQRAP